MRILIQCSFVLGLVCGVSVPFANAQKTANAQETASEDPTQSLYLDDFETDEERWQMTDPEAWKFENGRLKLYQKKSNYKPPFRSPRHIALLKEQEFESFQLDVQVLSTHEEYNHRDVCLFFGYQSPSQFYYVHLGKKTDQYANQIFVVNKAARTKISLTTTEGTPWDDQWHKVRIKRNVETGDIQVFFDDMQEPVMTAKDTTFKKGRVGLGSFDDIADFDDLNISELPAQSDQRP